jgi:hypothetical protein
VPNPPTAKEQALPLPQLPSLRATPKLSLVPEPQVAPEPAQPQLEPLRAEEPETPIFHPAKANEMPAGQPVTVQQVREEWKMYAERIRSQKPFVYNAMTQFEVDLQNGNDIVVKLSNPTLEEELLRQAVPAIGAHLRASLHASFQIVMQAAAPSEITTRKLYTSSDRFNHLAEQHPLLHEFKSMFGLDMEF